MKNILKFSLVSLCASGACLSVQANDNQSASNTDSDKQLVVTEPAGADASASVGTSGYQTTSTSYQTGSTSGGQPMYKPAGAAVDAPHMVTGREQDAYANCILHKYQAGKGSARATDEHYWNNVQPDRLYAQYPAGGASYQNYAYANTSYGSQPMSSSSSTFVSQPSVTVISSGQGGSGNWYAPDGRVYNSSGAQISGPRSGGANEAAGASGDQSGSSSAYSGGVRGGKSADQSTSGAQSSATQSGTSGAQSSTELKGSENQESSASKEAAGAQTGTSSSTDNSSQPSSTSSSSDQSSSSTQSSSTSSTSDMSDKVRSTLKSDSALSPIASNVQIQDQNGKVALTGSVKSEAERQQIVSKAELVAGSGNVVDNLQVQSDNNSGSSSNPSNP